MIRLLTYIVCTDRLNEQGKMETVNYEYKLSVIVMCVGKFLIIFQNE